MGRLGKEWNVASTIELVRSSDLLLACLYKQMCQLKSNNSLTISNANQVESILFFIWKVSRGGFLKQTPVFNSLTILIDGIPQKEVIEED